MKNDTTPKVSTRALARTIAAKHGCSLAAAQLAIDAAGKSVAARQATADALEPIAQRLVRDRGGMNITDARAAAERLLVAADPAPHTGADLVVSRRSAARKIAARRGVSIEIAQKLCEPRASR